MNEKMASLIGSISIIMLFVGIPLTIFSVECGPYQKFLNKDEYLFQSLGATTYNFIKVRVDEVYFVDFDQFLYLIESGEIDVIYRQPSGIAAHYWVGLNSERTVKWMVLRAV